VIRGRAGRTLLVGDLRAEMAGLADADPIDVVADGGAPMSVDGVEAAATGLRLYVDELTEIEVEVDCELDHVDEAAERLNVRARNLVQLAADLRTKGEGGKRTWALFDARAERLLKKLPEDGDGTDTEKD
jgi:hypothetical protein